MVLQKRLNYGFHGYQFPPIPRAARSARRRCSFKKKHDQVCAFDLLALVAGKLLLEKEPANEGQLEVANNNSVKEDIKDEEKPLKVETHDPPSPRGSFVVPDLISQVQEQNHSPRESVYSEDDLNLGLASAITSDLQEKSNALKLESGASKNEVEMIGCKVEAGPSINKKTSEYKVGSEMNRPTKDGHQKSQKVPNGALVNTSSVEDPVVWNGKPTAPFGSDDNPKVPSYGKHLSPSLYPAIRGDVNLVSRDDDENSSGRTYPRTIKKHLRPAPRIGDRRIKKILASRYWKVAPRLKEAALANGDGMKPVYHNRKNYYKPLRSEKIYPLKKRKYFQYSSPSPSTSDGAISSGFVSGSPRKGSGGDTSGCCPKMHEGTSASSSITAENTSFQPRDSHVKLRIKSFRVPELFIEIPESATVGSLKRSVMEAVTAILGGGLRVGVLLQGKKVRDDNKTLSQSGISHNNQLDSVGFSLEPNPSKVAPSLCRGVSPFLLCSDSPQPLSRYPPSPLNVHHGTCTSPDPHVNNPGNVESDHDSAPSPMDMSIDKSATDSKALVAVPAVNVESLAMVPVHRKSKRSEIVQRRIRRPFSVAEVEALVQAVEKLGTGRWRDVKLRAFDNAKHRTYVDLKDKWKTLVHTARISPQQRRGEPVPQELLDRVLTAHAYWSQHQAKQQQQVKHHAHPSKPETCLLL